MTAEELKKLSRENTPAFPRPKRMPTKKDYTRKKGKAVDPPED